MDASEEPFCVTVDDEPCRLVITAKKSEERNIITKKLKKTIIFRGIYNDPDDEYQCFIPCKHIKQRDKRLAVILVSMQMMRKIVP